MNKYAQEKGLPVTDVEVENYGKNLGYKLLDRSSKGYSSHKEIAKAIAAPAPKTSVSVRVGGSGEAPYNPLYEKLDKIGSTLLDKQHYNFIPINKLPGDLRDALRQSYANSKGIDVKEVSTANFAVNRLPNGEWGTFDAEAGKPVGNVVGTLSADELNVGFAKGKERATILKTEMKIPEYIKKGKAGAPKTKQGKKADPLGIL